MFQKPFKIIKGLTQFGKPKKCPNCGNLHFYWSHEGSRGETYWKCGKCNYLIKD